MVPHGMTMPQHGQLPAIKRWFRHEDVANICVSLVITKKWRIFFMYITIFCFFISLCRLLYLCLIHLIVDEEKKRFC